METYTATTRIKDRIGQQMVQVNQHSSNHDQPGPLPVGTEKKPGYQSRKQQVQPVMNNIPQYMGTFFHHLKLIEKLNPYQYIRWKINEFFLYLI